MGDFIDDQICILGNISNLTLAVRVEVQGHAHVAVCPLCDVPHLGLL